MPGVNNTMFFKISLSIFSFLCIAITAKADIQTFLLGQQHISEAKMKVVKLLKKKDYVYRNTKQQIFEIYYDLPELYYLKHHGNIRYTAVPYVSKKKHRVKLKESVTYVKDKNTSVDFFVRHYNKTKFVEDKHPLLTLIKRSQRNIFLEHLKQDGIKYPMRLKEILRVSKTICTFQISLQAVEINGSVSQDNERIILSKLKVSSLGRNHTFVLLETDLGKYNSLYADLQKVFPDALKTTSQYQTSFNQMKKNSSLVYSWLLKYPFLAKLGNTLLYALVGILIIILLLKTISKES